MPDRTVARVLALVGAMGAGAAVALISSDPLAEPILPTPVPWVVLAVVFVAAEVVMVRLHFRSEAHEFNLIEAPLVVGLFTATPLAVVTAAAVAVVAVRVLRRQSPLKALFNVAAGTLEASVACAVLHATVAPAPELTPRHWVAGFAAVAAATVVSSVMVAVVIMVAEQRLELAGFVRSMLSSLLISSATASMAIGGLIVVGVRPAAGLVLSPALVLVVVAYRSHVRAVDESGRLAIVAEITTAMAACGNDSHRVVSGLVDLLRDHLGAGIVQIDVQTSGAGPGPSLAVTGDGRGVRVTSGPGVEARTGGLPDRRGSDEIVVPLVTEDGTIGSIRVAERVGDVTSWTDGDRKLLVAVAHHAAAVLRSAELLSALTVLAAEHGRLRRESHLDPLTGLVNRRGLEVVVGEAAGLRARMAALYIDLDDFKDVNDSHGHAVGDRLLREVGERLRSVTRVGDVAARLGGDEFVLLLLPAPDRMTIAAIAERLQRVLAQPVFAGPIVLQPSASVGVAIGDELTDVDTLLQAADHEMYREKARHRAGVVRP